MDARHVFIYLTLKSFFYVWVPLYNPPSTMLPFMSVTIRIMNWENKYIFTLL